MPVRRLGLLVRWCSFHGRFAPVQQVGAPLPPGCLGLFSKLGMELSRFTRCQLRRITYVSFPTQPKAPWTLTPSVISSTLCLDRSSVLHKKMKSCIVPVHKLVHLFHRSSADDDSTLALAMQNKTKTTNNRVDEELITHVHKG